MRLVVTGAGGGLGRAFLACVPPHHEVHAFDHAALDIGDRDAVRAAIDPIGPDAILNLAAFTRVDENEADPARAVRDNAIGPQLLALAARACGAALLHVSTDYVFDGTKGAPYDELDAPAPLSTYGRTKLAGERHVAALCPEHVIVRTAQVYGGGDDFLTRAVRTLASDGDAGAIADRVGSPTFVGHVAERLLPLLLTGRWGTVHVAAPDPATWYDVLTRVKELAGLAGDVRSQRTDELGLAAPRPRYAALTSVYLPHLDVPPVPPLDDGLRAFLAAVGALA